MAYIGPDGNIVQRKEWSMKSVIDAFWAFISFIVLFFRGLFHLDDPVTKGQYGAPGRGSGSGGAPAYPRRRMGGFGSGGSGPAPPPCGTGGG